MTMSNAQAALIAAANAAVRGSAVPVEPVLKRAAAFLLWLDSQDDKLDGEINLVSINELHKPKTIVQCDAASANYTRCLLAKGHKTEHRNSQEGEYWGGEEPAEPKPEPVTHFYTGLDSAYAPCGKVMLNDMQVTAFIDDVTCGDCREALGL